MTLDPEVKDGPSQHGLARLPLPKKKAPTPAYKTQQLRGWLEDAKADIAMIEKNIAVAVKRGMDDAEGGPSGALSERTPGTYKNYKNEGLNDERPDQDAHGASTQRIHSPSYRGR